MPRRRARSGSHSPEKSPKFAPDSFNTYIPHVIQPHDIGWLIVAVVIFKRKIKEVEFDFLYIALLRLFNETLETRPTPWQKILLSYEAYGPGLTTWNSNVKGLSTRMKETAEGFRDLRVFQDSMSTILPLVCGPPSGRRADGWIFLRRSWLGIHARRIKLAYSKLSEAAIMRLHKGFCDWISDKPLDKYDFSPDVHYMPGYLLLPTNYDKRNRGFTDAYEAFQRNKHIGNTSAAADNLRQFFDQQFTEGKQAPRQHSLNALAHHYFTSGEMEAARLLASEAIDMARTVGDRETLINIMSLMRRFPPKPPPIFHNDPHENHLRKVLLERIDHQAKEKAKVPYQYTVIQPGTTPFDLLFDVGLELNSGGSLPILFRKRFEAIGCLDTPPDVQNESLLTQWSVWAVDAYLWNLAGMPQVSDILIDVILVNTSSEEEIRLHAVCAKARRYYQKGQYNLALHRMLCRNTWNDLSLAQFHFWSNEVWHLLWDIATRKSQERLKRDFLEPNRPKPSPFDTVDHDKKSPASIRKSIQDAADALRVKDYTRATLLILNALHFSETNGYWHLYRSAVPIFADLELQHGKTESAKRLLEHILPQVTPGDDLEQRAVVATVYARTLMAMYPKAQAPMEEALYWLQIAEGDYERLGMHISLQDTFYLQAIVYDSISQPVPRDRRVRHLRDAEKTAQEVSGEMDEGVVDIWDAVCEIGVAIASGDNFLD